MCSISGFLLLCFVWVVWGFGFFLQAVLRNTVLESEERIFF